MRAFLIFPHQLFEEVFSLEGDYTFYMVESHLFFKQYAFHKQKILFHRASMQAFAVRLRKGGWNEGVFGYFFSVFRVKCPLASQGLTLLVEQQATVFSLLRVKSGLEIGLSISQ